MTTTTCKACGSRIDTNNGQCRHSASEVVSTISGTGYGTSIRRSYVEQGTQLYAVSFHVSGREPVMVDGLLYGEASERAYAWCALQRLEPGASFAGWMLKGSEHHLIA